jgi:hypothetical protein
MYAAIEVRKHVPAPPSKAIIGGAASAFLLMPDDLVEAHRKLLEVHSKCWDKCIANLDPDTTTADRDKAYSALRQAQKTCVESSDNLRDWLDANTDKLVEAHEAFKVEAADEALALLDRLEQIADEVAARSQALSRCRDNRKSAQWSPLPRLSRKVGGDSLHNLRVGFEALLPKPEPTRVTNAAMAALRRGEDAKDIDGNVLTHEEAEALFRQGLLKVAHSPGGLWGGIPT